MRIRAFLGTVFLCGLAYKAGKIKGQWDFMQGFSKEYPEHEISLKFTEFKDKQKKDWSETREHWRDLRVQSAYEKLKPSGDFSPEDFM